jgi:hypothetical protein
MAITTAPLFSLGASGSIGKSIVYSSWKGLTYARQHVVPANPKTTAQTTVRHCFEWVHDAYKFLDAVVQESWIEYCKGKPLTPMNAWTQANLPALRGQTDLTAIVFSKPVNSGPPCNTATFTAGTTQITIAPTAPTVAAGWTITEAIAIAMQSMAPTGEKEAKISKADVDTTSPYSIVLTGLTTGQLYRCGAWFKFLRPDGVIAYGGAYTGTATPT